MPPNRLPDNMIRMQRMDAEDQRGQYRDRKLLGYVFTYLPEEDRLKCMTANSKTNKTKVMW